MLRYNRYACCVAELTDIGLANIEEVSRLAASAKPLADLGGTEKAKLPAIKFANWVRHGSETAANTPHRNGLLQVFYATYRPAGIDRSGPVRRVAIDSRRVSFATVDNRARSGISRRCKRSPGYSPLQRTMTVYAKAA